MQLDDDGMTLLGLKMDDDVVDRIGRRIELKLLQLFWIVVDNMVGMNDSVSM